MKFNVGPWVYSLRIMPGEIRRDGKRVDGLAVEAAREIQIAGTVIPEARLDVLLHELRHAWEYHCPIPATGEEEARFTSTIAAAAMKDLQAQGGRMSLMGLAAESIEPPAKPEVRYVRCNDIGNEADYEPASCLEHWESPAKATARRAQCGMCSLIVADGSVVTSKVRWDPEAGGRVVDRTLHCWHCGHLQKWTEGVDARGLPNGAVVRGPEYVSGDPVAAFLREHPQAAGLMAG